MSSAGVSAIEKRGFATIKDLLTINGAGLAIWIACSVFVTFLPSDISDDILCYILRYSAAILAIMCSYLIYRNTMFKLPDSQDGSDRNFKLNSRALIILNAFLIYLNAVGMNAISAGTQFTKPKQTKISLLPFLRDISWYPDLKLVAENDILREDNRRLNAIVSNSTSVDESVMAYIKVLVTDESGMPIKGAAVQIDNGPLFKLTSSDNNGIAKFDLFERDIRKAKSSYKYRVLVRKDGYDDYQRDAEHLQVIFQPASSISSVSSSVKPVVDTLTQPDDNAYVAKLTKTK